MPADAREIRFAVRPCSLGLALAAGTGAGACAILLGDDAEVLARDLQARFPRAHLVADHPAFAPMAARAVELVEDPGAAWTLALDLGGTPFQREVWAALGAIPAGSTATYAQGARALGRPEAVRAVAGACGANALAVAIPCHRVVRSDGGLSGYRWGVARKAELLRREGAMPGLALVAG